jgi:hypothetical protein
MSDESAVNWRILIDLACAVYHHGMSTALHKTIEQTRHYCRHPKCRSKLPEIVDNPRLAFCSRACYIDFYRRHCLVCETEIPATKESGIGKGGRSNRKFCSKKCKRAVEANPHAFDLPARFVKGQKSEN